MTTAREIEGSTGTTPSSPRALVTLAGVEMWERFSYYGLQVILAFYLYYSLTDGGLGLPTATALGVTGSYGGIVYLSQILGGWVADRVLAARTTVLVAGVSSCWATSSSPPSAPGGDWPQGSGSSSSAPAV